MAADLFSSFIGMTLQATGNNNNAWGTILNGSALQTLERAIAGNISRAVTGGTLDLSGTPPPAAVTQVLDAIQIFTGTLTANQIVILPNLSRIWNFINETTGAFQLLLQTSGGTFVNIPQGTAKLVTCDGAGNLLRADRDQVGNFEYNTIGKPGTLQCNGASLLKTYFPDLYLDIGTTYGSVDSLHFTLPLLTDTGRFLRSTTSTLTVGTYQANQNLAHTHGGASFSGTTSNESNGHSHTGSGTSSGQSVQHVHTGTTDATNTDHSHNGSGTTSAMSANASHSHQEYFPNGGSGASWYVGTNQSTVANLPGVNTAPTNTDHTHTYSFTTGGMNSNATHTHTFTSAVNNVDHNHTYSFTTSGVSAFHTHTYSGTTGTIPSSGGSEARPEALAVVISIRY